MNRIGLGTWDRASRLSIRANPKFPSAPRPYPTPDAAAACLHHRAPPPSQWHFLIYSWASSVDYQSLRFGMGNKPTKQDREEILVKAVPPLDRAFVRWLARDLERIHGFAPKNPRAIKPPEHYAEYMRLNGWLDVNLDDPDLAHLLK